MLEIICLIWLWRVNGKHAIERGQNPKKYRALTLGLWFGLEFTGTFVGAWLMQLLNAGYRNNLHMQMSGWLFQTDHHPQK